MKAPKIKLNGNMYQISSIEWNNDGSLDNIEYLDTDEQVWVIIHAKQIPNLEDCLVFE